MRLSREEESFLRHWMYDEVHYHDGECPAKQLQLQHRAVPADLAVLIAAAIPDPAEQEAAGLGPPPAESLAWPWTEEALRARLVEARSLLARRNREAAPTSEVESTRSGMADGS
jgi:hypothetical protein